MEIGDATIYFAVGAWLTSITVALLIWRKSKSIDKKIDDLWNMKIELKDLDGEVIKVPVQYKKGETESGEAIIETKMVVAPLWYTIMFTAATIIEQKVKMSLLGAKGALGNKLKDAALKEGMESGDLGTLMAFLPKKAQQAIAVIKAAQGLGLKQRGKPGTNQETASGGGQGYNPG